MKKLTALLLAALMALSLVACGNTNDGEDTDTSVDTNADTNADTAADTAVETDPVETEPVETEPVVTITDSLELLTNVWGAYAEDQKFFPMGGDYNEANQSMEGPGRFGLEDAELIDSMLGLPAANVADIDDAASLMHGMNANTFTGAAYRLINAENAATVAEAVKTNLADRQWMCGFPEKLVVISVENYLVTAFGNGEVIDTFVTNLKSVYANASVLVEEAL